MYTVYVHVRVNFHNEIWLKYKKKLDWYKTKNTKNSSLPTSSTCVHVIHVHVYPTIFDFEFHPSDLFGTRDVTLSVLPDPRCPYNSPVWMRRASNGEKTSAWGASRWQAWWWRRWRESDDTLGCLFRCSQKTKVLLNQPIVYSCFVAIDSSSFFFLILIVASLVL